MSDRLTECAQLLHEWPSDKPFSVDDVLRQHPEFGQNSDALELLVSEEYIRTLEQEEAVTVSSFVASYPNASPSLASRLRKLTQLHQETGLLRRNTPAVAELPSVGQSAYGYYLLEELGRGAYSHVFLAADENAGHRRVVVKVAIGDHTEAELLGPLSHPNLPKILNCRKDPERNLTVVCMDFIGTRTLVDEIRTLHGTPTQLDTAQLGRTVVTVLRQILAGLAHAHEHGVLHLDIKPGNVVFDRHGGHAVLIDFNLSAPSSCCHELPFRGTFDYAAPELLESAVTGHLGVNPVSPASDVYSIGVVFYEMLTGELPWPRPSYESLQEAAAEALNFRRNDIEPASARNPILDPRFDDIIKRALAYSPEARFQTPREFSDALDAVQRESKRSGLPVRSLVAGASILTVALGLLFDGVPAKNTGQPPSDYLPVPVGDAQRAPETFPPSNWAQRLQELDEHTDDELRVFLNDLKVAGVNTSSDFALLGYASLLLHDYVSASSALRTAAGKGFGDDLALQLNLGYSYLQNRQYRVAARVLEGVLEFAPSDARTLFLLAIVELEMSRESGAPHNVEYSDQLQKSESEFAHDLASVVEAHALALLADQSSPTNPTLRGTSPLPHPREPAALALGLPLRMELTGLHQD